MSSPRRILVTCPQMQRTIEHFRDRLEAAGLVLDLPEVVQALSESELLQIIDQYDGMIAGDDELTAAVIEKADRMRVISKWGIGVDGIDQQAAVARGIVVTNTPGAFGEEVADVALGYVLMLARGLHVIDRSVRDGGWAKPVGLSLGGQTLGVVGLGSIGLATARRGLAFGLDVLGYDPFEEQRQLARGLGARPVELAALLATSRFVVLCCPLTVENRHLISATTLAQMRRDAYLINVARGPLVDEAALDEALASGVIAGAALDVFEGEPLPADSPLRARERTVFGSHNGSNTEAATLRVSALAVDNLLREIDAT